MDQPTQRIEKQNGSGSLQVPITTELHSISLEYAMQTERKLSLLLYSHYVHPTYVQVNQRKPWVDGIYLPLHAT